MRRQLDRVFASPDFDASRRSREFLRFIVEETLAGRGELLTQGAIATTVFGRKDDFDPVVDPIVRIQAGRLRRSLERYYLLSGRQDPLRIELPRGTYVPVFRAAVGVEEPPPTQELPLTAVGPGIAWPVVLFEGFEATSDTSELRAIAERMGEELVLELGRYGVAHVVRLRNGNGVARDLIDGARFAISARVAAHREGWRVTAHLTDRRTGQETWGDEYVTVPDPGRWSGSAEDVARVIAARIGAEEGVIVQQLSAERRTLHRAPATPYETFLLSCEALFARDRDTFAGSLAALRQVLDADPDCAWAWTRLARMCVANWSMEVTDVVTPIEDAITFAQQGVRADPSSRIARCILASALLIRGELDAARAELDQALRCSPDSLVYLEIIGYLLIMVGDWDRGREISQAALERNPHCLPHVHFGLWAFHLHRGELELAHRAALDHRDGAYFIRSAIRATCFGLLGRIEEGRMEVARLLASKPDFTTRGRTLLGHYIKFPDVMDRVVEGLGKAGLRLP